MLERGLTFQQIALTQFAYYWGVFLFEVPTGIIADKLGRKKSLLLCICMKALGILASYYAYSLWPFIISEIFFALARALYSGAGSAFLYDSLLQIKEENLYKKLEGRAHGLHMLGLTSQSIYGAILIVFFGLESLYIASILACIISFWLVVKFKEPLILQHIEEKKRKIIRTAVVHFAQSLRLITKNIKMIWLIAYFSLVFILSRSTLVSLQQPFLQYLSFDESLFPLLDGVITLGAAGIALMAHWIEEKIGFKKVFLFLLSIFAISYFGMASSISKIGVIFLFIQMFIYGLYPPVMRDYLNKEIQDSSKRATVLSIESLFSRGLFSVYALFLGYILEFYTVTHALYVTGIIGVVLGGVIVVSSYFLPKETH